MDNEQYSSQAVHLARKKLPPGTFKEINRFLHRGPHEPRVFAVDGSNVHVRPLFIYVGYKTRTNNKHDVFYAKNSKSANISVESEKSAVPFTQFGVLIFGGTKRGSRTFHAVRRPNCLENQARQPHLSRSSAFNFSGESSEAAAPFTQFGVQCFSIIKRGSRAFHVVRRSNILEDQARQPHLAQSSASKICGGSSEAAAPLTQFGV